MPMSCGVAPRSQCGQRSRKQCRRNGRKGRQSSSIVTRVASQAHPGSAPVPPLPCCGITRERDRGEGESAMIEPQATILVVDDDAKNVKLMEAPLRPRGYAVITASNGAEALHQVHRAPPDLVLLDVMMPMVDGFEVC